MESLCRYAHPVVGITKSQCGYLDKKNIYITISKENSNSLSWTNLNTYTRTTFPTDSTTDSATRTHILPWTSTWSISTYA